ncbi:Ubiquitin carboxyl-terminal hydrolase 24 [Sparganum proliferum]
MGFDNESRIEEALVTANNDIDSAISILVNGILDTQSSEARLSFSDARNHGREESSSDPDFSTSTTDEFPVAEYSRLEASVFVEKWNIPCLRSQSFGICLQSSIRLVEKQGFVVFSKVEELKRFVTTCLDECLKKLLTSSAVLTWDAETLEGVHNMLELVVQLAAEFLKAVYDSFHTNDQRDSVVTTPSFNLPSGKTLIEAVCNAYDKPFEQTEANVHLTAVFLRYLNLIFDPECSYHQRCRDRATNTGTYIDEFNHWTPSPEVRQADAEVYAEVLPAPKNFYLVNLINCFGMCGGFPVLRWLSTRRLTPLDGVQVFEMTTCLRVLCYRITSLKLPASESCVAPITTEEVCTPCQPDWDQLMSRCQTDADLLATLKMLFSVPLIDELHLSLLLTSLCPPVGAVGGSFANRLLAISQLIDLLTAVQSSRSDRDRSDVRSVSSGGTSRRFTGSASLLAMENMAFLSRRKLHRLVRFETLMSWLKDKHVIQRLMTNLDNETYMSKIGELLRCLRERITLEDITVLWRCQEGQSAAAVTNILQLLADVGACCFSQPQLDHLFNLIRGVIHPF